ncbi:hypothetical protein HZF05_05625 [Sphingomonas sp. CGMCC 1.13654]|uniref:Extradiol ring-cleavage dioxygenase class III enzyme subunit B domain-containing protein n=1 Tax=Sphingomonas chungangi TaxID=2683589 RepID=A0A838L4R7_9SPHN|nr:hypothetical protein [Sphingomonas chungangi]MBA2933572.1 hypothetical protein [Sphingomonas chungangi]MVW54905.1 hypothetical protein [Sphingomonas chungangi]
MPIVLGAGVSYSPLMYRPRDQWPAVASYLVGTVVQPARRALEGEALLDDYARRIDAGLAALAGAIAEASLDALIVLHADRGTVFDASNIPQMHIQVGGEIWGDPAIAALDEPSRRHSHLCDEAIAELLIEELVAAGFDVAEARGAFRPIGDPRQGAAAALSEAVSRLSGGVPIIPLHINCHVDPMPTGRRLATFGRALAAAAALADRRIGLLVTGGMSGDPGGPMAGWIDDVLDQWMLTRLVRGQSREIATIWAARSRTLEGGSGELRLWTLAAAAFEEAGCRARVIDYLPVHHAAAGIAFVRWES